jgi:predicted nucleic acid-binding protein
VPAQVHHLDDPLPPVIVADTSFLLVGVNGQDPRHPRARRLLDRMETEGTVVMYCQHVFLLELWSACSGFVRTLRKPASWARLISAAETAGATGRRRLTAADVPGDMEGRYRLAVETFERLVGAQLADLETVSVRLTLGLLARARDAIFSHSHSLRSYDAVMLALAEEAAARTGTERHLATFDHDFLAVDGLDVWGQGGRTK